MKLSSGFSENGEYKSTLYSCKTKNRYEMKRYFIYIERVDGQKEQTDLGNGVIAKVPKIEYLEGDDWREWYKIHQVRPA